MPSLSRARGDRDPPHNSAYCTDCFLLVFREQVRTASVISTMFRPEDRIVVAVSGGKDSLALWDVLLD